MDIKVEIKDEPMSPSGTLTQVKCEDENTADFHRQTVLVSPHFVNVSADFNENDSKTKIKDEPCWSESQPVEIKHEMELPFVADSDLQNEESSSHTETTETLAEGAAALRLITESLCGHTISSSCYFKRTNSTEYSSGNNMLDNAETSHVLNSIQSQEERETNLILSSNVKGGSLIQNFKNPHKCEICGKSFRYLSVLKQHSVRHEDKKPFKCDICERSFGLASNLKRHKLSHEGIRSHTCEICNKSFVRSSNLKEHKLTHEGRRPHTCEICNKGFTHASNLKPHKLTHEGEKPHVCEICKKRFSRASDMKNHKLVHEGKRLHICKVCNKSFIRPSTLKQHKLIHGSNSLVQV